MYADPIRSAIDTYAAIERIGAVRRQEERQARQDEINNEYIRLNMDATRQAMEQNRKAAADAERRAQMIRDYINGVLPPEMADELENTSEDAREMLANPQLIPQRKAAYLSLRNDMVNLMSGKGGSVQAVLDKASALPEIKRRLTKNGRIDGRLTNVLPSPDGRGFMFEGEFREQMKDANGRPMTNPDGTPMIRVWTAPLTENASSEPGDPVKVYTIHRLMNGIDENLAILETLETRSKLSPEERRLRFYAAEGVEAAIRDLEELRAEGKQKARTEAIIGAMDAEKDPSKKAIAALRGGANVNEAKALYDITNPDPQLQDYGYGQKIDRYGRVHKVPVAPRYGGGGGGGGGGGSALDIYSKGGIKTFQTQINKAADTYKSLEKMLFAYEQKMKDPSSSTPELDRMFGSGAKFNQNVYNNLRQRTNEARRAYEGWAQEYYNTYGNVYSPLTGPQTRAKQAAPPANSGRAIAEHKPQAGGKKIDRATAERYLAAAGGDANKARAKAKADGWEF